MAVFMAVYRRDIYGILRNISFFARLIRFTEGKHSAAAVVERASRSDCSPLFRETSSKDCKKLKYWVLMALIDFNQSSAVELYRSYRKFRRIQYLFLLLSETWSEGKLPLLFSTLGKLK